ncbi:MAG: hypothetical protein EOO37_02625 [Cytophagaceae bacterium]|nr:MAG: hypothetical protein EOO37_02625 [Cytophagaceae bacterium]
MAIEDSAVKEVYALVADWARRNDKILRDQITKLGIGVHEELYPSVVSKTYELAAAEVGMDLSFMTHGRFRDMGVGRGTKPGARDLTIGGIIAQVESQDRNGRLIRRERGKGGRFKKSKEQPKGRKPAKWYSRAFYGRLTALSGAISGKMVEKAIAAVKAVDNA